ncbi:hypothetical protein AX14_013763 [Amanita brunnescens Koide BX004]|nr:hypothetical protein AX14_003439 [Amanita brunnescens Koide BX004]KAF8706940.1 hypothetical protein AX14_013763 [Amanita brunnescens Koide BX004]
MKLLGALLFFVLATLSLAQNTILSYPPQGKVVHPGENLTVVLERPNSLTNSFEVSVVISIVSCAQSPCLPPSDVLGYVMYQGPYKPMYHQPEYPPHENFTVTIPSGFQKGPAQLNVAHFALVGAGPYPWLELHNTTLIVD